MTRSKVYVLGSINIDLVINTDRIPNKGETISGHHFMINSGGKGANQAIAAAKLGADVKMIGAIGSDPFNEIAKTALKEGEVDTTYVKTSMTNTGVAVIIKCENDNRIILDGGSNLCITDEDIEHGLSEAGENDLFISQFEVNNDAVLYGLKLAKAKKMITILNPAPVKPIQDDLYPFIDYLVINQTEAELLTGIYPTTTDDVVKISEMLKAKGTKNIVVTMGEIGAAMITDAVYFENAHQIEVVDTVGAGDSFIGAIAYGLTEQMTEKELLKLGNATSAIVCMHDGVQGAMPSLQDVQIFLQEREGK